MIPEINILHRAWIHLRVPEIYANRLENRSFSGTQLLYHHLQFFLVCSIQHYCLNSWDRHLICISLLPFPFRTLQVLSLRHWFGETSDSQPIQTRSPGEYLYDWGEEGDPICEVLSGVDDVIAMASKKQSNRTSPFAVKTLQDYARIQKRMRMQLGD